MVISPKGKSIDDVGKVEKFKAVNADVTVFDAAGGRQAAQFLVP